MCDIVCNYFREIYSQLKLDIFVTNRHRTGVPTSSLKSHKPQLHHNVLLEFSEQVKKNVNYKRC